MNKKFNNGLKLKILVIIVLFISILPALRWNYLSIERDMQFWIKRVDGLVDAINNGIIPYRINSMANSGYGGADPIFYPYIFMYVIAFIYKITNDYNISFNIFNVLVQILTASVMYYSVRDLFEDKKIATVATIINLLSVLRLRSIYTSICIGEYLAICFIPLIIEGYANIIKGKYNKWIDLLIGCFFISQSHIITLFYIGALMIIITIVLLPVIIKDKNKLFSFVKTGIIFILLNLWYYVPFIQYYLSNSVVFPQVGTMWGLASKLSFIDNIVLMGKIFFNNFSIDMYNSIYDRASLMTIFAIMYSLIYLITNNIIYKNSKNSNIDEKIVNILIIIWIFNLLASAGLFTRTFFGKIILIQKFFNIQQFENRELKRALPFIYIAFSYIICKKNTGIKKYISIILLIILSIIPVAQLYANLFNTGKSYDRCIDFANGDYIIKKSIEGNPIAKIKVEYNYTLPNDIFDGKIKEKEVSISNVKKKYLSYEFDYEKSGNGDGEVVIPLFNYIGYVGIDGKKNLKIKSGENALITVPIKKNNGHIKIYYKENVLWIICDIISTLTLISIIIFMLNKFVNKKIKSC